MPVSLWCKSRMLVLLRILKDENEEVSLIWVKLIESLLMSNHLFIFSSFDVIFVQNEY